MKYNSPQTVLNHYKLMYGAGKFKKDGAAYKRMHQLFDEICLDAETVRKAKIVIKQYEEYGDIYVQ